MDEMDRCYDTVLEEHYKLFTLIQPETYIFKPGGFRFYCEESAKKCRDAYLYIQTHKDEFINKWFIGKMQGNNKEHDYLIRPMRIEWHGILGNCICLDEDMFGLENISVEGAPYYDLLFNGTWDLKRDFKDISKEFAWKIISDHIDTMSNDYVKEMTRKRKAAFDLIILEKQPERKEENE